MNNSKEHDHLEKEQQEVLDSINVSKIIVPVLLGIAVVAYLIWRQFDIEDFRTISWDGNIVFWILMAILCYVLRHIFYAYRLMKLSDHDFSFTKSVELIFIWEFASSVSPTSIGGSAVALFLLAQEKIATARAVAIVIYSVVIDTLFFVISVPILYFLIGPKIIRPGIDSLNEMGGFGYTLIIVLVMMTLYSLLFFYGLFINPERIRDLLIRISKWKLMSRFQDGLVSTANDIVVSAKEMRSKPVRFHLNAWIGTAGAWVFRFLAINCIIIAVVASTPRDLWTQMLLYSRGLVMYAVTAFSPTPGAAGIAEIVFGGFYSDYVSKGVSFLAALFWRLITYYPYLIIGVVIIPNWIRNVLNRRRKRKSE